MSVPLLIADDHVMVLEALRGILDAVADIDVVAAVSDPDAVVPKAAETRPRVALLDVCMQSRDGLSVAQELWQVLPSCAVVLISATADAALVRHAVRQGVLGFVPKHAGLHQLVTTVRAVAAGQLSIPPAMAGSLVDPGGSSPLTSRELDVLRETATGASAADIAARLFLAPGTVRNVASAAMKKLGAHNRFEAVLIAKDRGWLG